MATLISTTNPDRFHNMPAVMLADLIGDLDCQSKAIEAELKATKDALKARGQASVAGNRFAITFTSSIRQTLDSAAVKAAMGQAWMDGPFAVARKGLVDAPDQLVRAGRDLLPIRTAYDEAMRHRREQIDQLEDVYSTANLDTYAAADALIATPVTTATDIVRKLDIIDHMEIFTAFDGPETDAALEAVCDDIRRIAAREVQS
jgi:hypothetical protein